MPTGDDSPGRNGIATERVDFIKRLFAIAVSVGFAIHIDAFEWLPAFDWPSPQIFEHSLLLLASMVFVVASWEGYLRSVEKTPLDDAPRFLLDIVIVFSYLLLMNAADDINAFIRTIIFIFVLYILWDIAKLAAIEMLELVGIITTVCWTSYFLLIEILRHATGHGDFLDLFVLLVYGAVLYRIDKWKKIGLRVRMIFALPPLPLVFLPYINQF